MSLIYAFITPCDLTVSFENSLLSPNPEELVKFSAPLEKAFTEIKDWANLNGGMCLSAFGNQICIRMPITKASEIASFMQKYEFTSKVCFAVGVGTNPFEAYKAMLSSEEQSGAKIVFYSDDLEQESVEDELEKNLSENQYGFELPNFNLEKDEAPEEQQKPQTKDANVSTKQKVIEALMLIKQKAPVISQLKQVDPQAYEAIKKLVDAMVRLASGVSGQDTQQ
jgi:hypothetical protein